MALYSGSHGDMGGWYEPQVKEFLKTVNGKLKKLKVFLDAEKKEIEKGDKVWKFNAENDKTLAKDMEELIGAITKCEPLSVYTKSYFETALYATDINRLKILLTEADKLPNMLNTIDQLVVEVAGFQENIEKEKGKKNKLSEEIKKRKDDQDKLSKEIMEGRKEKNRLFREIEKRKGDQNKLFREIAALKKQIDKKKSALEQNVSKMRDGKLKAGLEAQLTNEIKTLEETKLPKLEKDFSDVEKELDKLEKDFSDVKKDLPKLEENLSAVEKELDKLEKDLPKLEKGLAKLEKDLSDKKEKISDLAGSADVTHDSIERGKELVPKFKKIVAKFMAELEEYNGLYKNTEKNETIALRKEIIKFEDPDFKKMLGKGETEYENQREHYGALIQDCEKFLETFKKETIPVIEKLLDMRAKHTKTYGDLWKLRFETVEKLSNEKFMTAFACDEVIINRVKNLASMDEKIFSGIS